MAKKSSHTSALSFNAIDQLCFEALRDIIADARQGLMDLSADVFASMSTSLDDASSKDALDHLMALYGASLDQNQNEASPSAAPDSVGTADHNDAVGDMVDLLQKKMASGEDISVEHLSGSAYDNHEAVSLAEHQKKLESLILADDRLKQHIVPAMASMQIEDSINQRLSHIVDVWQSVVGLLERSDNGADVEDVAKTLGKSCHSAEQANDYYGLVLETKAPEAIEKRSVFIEF
jgi:hypothetical protein